MPKVHQPAFAQTPRTWTAVVTAAAADLDTDEPTGTVLLAEAGAEGCIMTSLTAIARATATASSLLIFLSKDGGTTQRLIGSALLPAHTVAATTAIPVVDFGYTETEPLRLEAGDQIYVGAGVALAGGIVFAARSTDF